MGLPASPPFETTAVVRLLEHLDLAGDWHPGTSRTESAEQHSSAVAAAQQSGTVAGSHPLLPGAQDARTFTQSSSAATHLHGGGQAGGNAAGDGVRSNNTYQPPDPPPGEPEFPDSSKRSSGLDAFPSFSNLIAGARGGGNAGSNSSFRTAASGLASPSPRAMNTFETAHTQENSFVRADEEEQEGGRWQARGLGQAASIQQTIAATFVPVETSGERMPPAAAAFGPEEAEGAGSSPAANTDGEFLTAKDGEGARGGSQESVTQAGSSGGNAPKTPSRAESRGSTTQKRSGGVAEALSTTPGGLLVVAAENKATAKLSRQLVKQLNRFKGKEQLFLQRFKIKSGSASRRLGGNSIVQFATTPADNREWAIKFFLSPTTFENESVLYAAHYPELRSQLPIAAAERAGALKRAVQGAGHVWRAGAGAKFLPRVELSVGLHGGLMDPKGMPLPPCVMMEMGEGLLEWWAHVERSPAAATRVLASVSECLANMHEAGFVHRNFKPSSVVFLSQSMKFIVAGFSAAERIGGTRPHAFALAYAAPEVVQFADERAGERVALEATTPMDSWSMGVVAIELLTGKSALDVEALATATVVAQLKGDALLPWEGEGTEAEALRQQLGALKDPILALLHREPRKRFSMRHFQALCRQNGAGAQK